MNAHRVLGILTTGITVAGGVIGALGIKAANMAMEFERFTATIGGGLGSLDKGKEVMSALEDYAQKSAFGLQDLAQATTQMVAAGLNIQQVLPMAERFALIISGTNPEGLMQVAGALARIKGGSFGEAMEIFRRAGVSATDLKAQGVSVTKGGEILGSPTQIMAAIERISQGRPKEMADAISKTSSVTISNSMDALDKGFREVGSSILNSALPAISKLTESFNDIVSGGGLNGISDAITSVIEKFTGDRGLTSIIGIVTTALKSVAWWADKLTGRDSSDPSYQAYVYAETLKSYNAAVAEHNINFSPCAYLHNMRDGSVIKSEFYKEHIEKAHEFFMKYGKGAIIFSRFIPILRTFMPIAAGVAHMEYKSFLKYSLIGSFVWSTSVTLVGYFLGQVFPKIKDYMTWVVIIVVLLSVLPAVVEMLRKTKNDK
jgi:membrane protein DedA with SNARE-associated domain